MDHNNNNNNNSKEKQVVVDIENDEASRDPVVKPEWGKKSLNKLVSGVLGYNGLLSSEESDDGDETTKLLANDECEQGNKKPERVKKASKPPRPPRGPSLDASDIRLIKEISKIAMKKRERNERMKALKRMKASKLSVSSSASSSSSAASASSSLMQASGSTILAMIITVLFFLVLLFQGLGSGTGLNMRLTGGNQPATPGLAHVEFYKTVLSDNSVAPSPSSRAV